MWKVNSDIIKREFLQFQKCINKYMCIIKTNLPLLYLTRTHNSAKIFKNLDKHKKKLKNKKFKKYGFFKR